MQIEQIQPTSTIRLREDEEEARKAPQTLASIDAGQLCVGGQSHDTGVRGFELIIMTRQLFLLLLLNVVQCKVMKGEEDRRNNCETWP